MRKRSPVEYRSTRLSSANDCAPFKQAAQNCAMERHTSVARLSHNWRKHIWDRKVRLDETKYPMVVDRKEDGRGAIQAYVPVGERLVRVQEVLDEVVHMQLFLFHWQ